MPNKHNDKYRHKFKKTTYKVKNWAEYNGSLRKRGDITDNLKGNPTTALDLLGQIEHSFNVVMGVGAYDMVSLHATTY